MYEMNYSFKIDIVRSDHATLAGVSRMLLTINGLLVSHLRLTYF